VTVAASDWGVIGHDAAVAQLQRAVATGVVRHALLLTGPVGVGKTTLANAYVSALVCETPPTPGAFCGDCRSCRKVARGVHPDIQRFDLATQAERAEKAGTRNTSITIDTVRAVASTAALRPIEARWRVAILDDAETMADVAQEALLKTLEEPPRSMLLIVLCDDIEALLPTVRSRCQIVELRPAPATVITDMLVARGQPVDEAAVVASLAGGAPGWALRALAAPTLRAEREQAVAAAISWIASPGYDRLVEAARTGDGFGKQRADTLARLGMLLAVWRDALLLVAGRADRMTFTPHAARLAALGGGWTLDAVTQAVRSVQICMSDLEANVRPRLALETMVLQWPKPRA
jgi:DNA polymerase-3 subunit delta'